jgi:hypothetical protein
MVTRHATLRPSLRRRGPIRDPKQTKPKGGALENTPDERLPEGPRDLKYDEERHEAIRSYLNARHSRSGKWFGRLRHQHE